MHFIFRVALVLSPILVLSPARAASPEDRYIAARDAAIAKFAKQEKDGKIDEAIDCFAACIGNGFSYRDWAEHDSNLDAIRDDPRFAELMTRL